MVEHCSTRTINSNLKNVGGLKSRDTIMFSEKFFFLEISFILVKLDDCHLLDYKFENIFCSESFAYYLIAFGELIE